MFIPSPQQKAVIDWVTSGKGSTFVEAVAGAGKTTTLIELLKKTTGDVVFTAYNKKIAEEISAKVTKLGLGSRIKVGTFHSFGLKAWFKVYPKVKMDVREKEKILNTYMKNKGISESLFPFVHKLVSLAKQRALGLNGSIDDRTQWFSIVEHFDLVYDLEDDQQIEIAITTAIDVLKESNKLSSRLINFDDMIYMPVISGCKMYAVDWILVDEAQDTNPARRALARKMLKPQGRAVFVGDRCQAIYGFSGADSDAIDQIIHDFDCKTLPLTVTYRCPKTVVKQAQTVVNHITASTSAPEGIVRKLETITPKEPLTALDAILCRKTAPLIDLAYNLIRNEIACHVEGRDIGASLINLVKRYKVKTVSALFNKMDTWVEKETQKLIAKGKETQADSLIDRVDTLRVIAENCSTIDELINKINRLFKDSEHEDKPTLTLSTVHKAKGREWNKVYILGHDTMMPSPYARQEWQKIQENNIIYVAYTRAKNELILCT